MCQPIRDLQQHLRDFENQFDNAQGNLRGTAALWTLAGIGGVSGAAAVDASSIFGALGMEGAGTFSLISLISFIVILGVANLWQIDQFVYQRLLHSVFAYGMIIEEDLPARERLRNAINARVPDVTNALSLYYAGPITVYLAIFFASNLAQSDRESAALTTVLWILFAVSTIGALGLWFNSKKDDVSAAKEVILAKMQAMEMAARPEKAGASTDGPM